MKNKKIYYIYLLMLLMLLTGCRAADQCAEQVQTNIASENTYQSDILQTEPILSQEHESTETLFFIETAESENVESTPERFFFQPDENVICVYEGTIKFDSINDKYALYKETAEKDIVFVNMLFVEKETGMIFTWEGENLVSVSMQEAEKLDLPGNSELETEYDWLYETIPESELLSKVMELLKETGHSEKNLIYDGTIDFINRSYYMVSAFENFEDHIIRGQTYYIDRKNGYLYRVEEEPDFLRTELYYIGDFITETIQSFSIEEMRTFKKNHSVILYEELENILTKTPSKSESNDQNDEIYDLLNHDLLGKDFLNSFIRILMVFEIKNTKIKKWTSSPKLDFCIFIAD